MRVKNVLHQALGAVLFVSLALFAVSGCDFLNERSSGGGEGPGTEGDVGAGPEGGPSYEVDTPSTGGFDIAVTFKGNLADRTGAAQYRCWDEECWHVVWCENEICDGSWSWSSFPYDGEFTFIWKGVNEKCAGSPPYELRINGEAVKSGEVAQWGSCSSCPDKTGKYGIYKDYNLGTYQLKSDDTVALWAQTEFSCGLNGPGAYAAHTSLVAEGNISE
ncbi:MAG: hypothetical protein QF586_05285 [Arenicellales bacterium]|nr:hypothetical protein [Arenicellales bacterium]MDP6435063.1 hypothetical protein [Arenicellales bacterium]MDP6672017.1 hypothetical protein [Arenicellales bacterium]HJL65352.1 hypothetical protein [Arenicellales bacterium]